MEKEVHDYPELSHQDPKLQMIDICRSAMGRAQLMAFLVFLTGLIGIFTDRSPIFGVLILSSLGYCGIAAIVSMVVEK